MKHTPGPWGCVDTSYHAHDYRLTKPDGMPLPLHVEANDHSVQRANAELIAAAPDLLNALIEILNHFVPMQGNLKVEDDAIKRAHAAISAATGSRK